MNGTHLTLTLAAALAAAGALSRHGSRSTFPSADEVRSANNSFFDALGRLAGEQQLFFMGPFVIVGDRKGGVLGRLEVRVGMSAVASGLCVRLGFLGVGKDERREGRGGRLLQMVCDAADEVGLPVELDVSPQKQHGQSKAPMNKVQLRDFYGKFGFQKVKRMGANFMRREAGAGSRAGSPARRLADGLPAQAEGFRWRRIGAGGRGVLERHGSRSAWKPYRIIEVFRPSEWNDSVQLLNDNPVLLRVEVEGVQEIRVTDLDQWRMDQLVDEWTPRDLHRAVVSFSKWIASLYFPLSLYRGLRTARTNIRMSKAGEPLDDEHDHWTTDLEVARGFAYGTHPEASMRSKPGTGVVLTGFRARPSRDTAYLLDYWLRFSDNPSYRVEPEYEYFSPDSDTLRILEQR